MSQTQTIYVVDDDEPVRDSIQMLLESIGLDCIGFASAKAFLEAYVPGQPGCLVLDIRMPGMSGLELQERLLEREISLPIVFITGHGDIPMAVEAMKRGAADFIRKPFREQELLASITEALQLDESRSAETQALSKAQTLVAKLTPREAEVFQRVAAGQANKVIAIELGVSERTIEIHRSKVMQKTEVRSLADLVRLQLLLEQAHPVD